MRVGFYLVGSSPEYRYLGGLAAQVAKQTMPGVKVVHLTDINSPRIPNVDEVKRMPKECPMAVFRMRHHQTPGDWLFIDVDVLVVVDASGSIVVVVVEVSAVTGATTAGANTARMPTARADPIRRARIDSTLVIGAAVGWAHGTGPDTKESRAQVGHLVRHCRDHCCVGAGGMGIPRLT